MTIRKAFDCAGIRGFADRIRHVNRVKIRMRDETVHSLQPNMIGIDVIWFLPSKRFDGRICSRSGGGRFRPDGRVFAIGLIPDRYDFGAMLGGQNTGSQLGAGLMGESVSYAK